MGRRPEVGNEREFPSYASVKPDIVRGKSAGVRVGRGAQMEFVWAMACKPMRQRKQRSACVGFIQRVLMKPLSGLAVQVS